MNEGDKLVFNTTDKEWTHLNGQTVEMIDIVHEPNTGEMYIVEPEIGGPFAAFPNELTDKESK